MTGYGKVEKIPIVY